MVRSRRRAHWAAYVAAGSSVAAGLVLVPGVPVQGRGAVAEAPVAAAPDPDERIAFTDERDGLDEVTFFRGFGTGTTVSVPTGSSTVEHEGEASTGLGGMVYVSTRDSAWGDVYLHNEEGPATRITCDTDGASTTESHPVTTVVEIYPYSLSAVAFAARTSESWDVYIAVPRPTLTAVPAEETESPSPSQSTSQSSSPSTSPSSGPTSPDPSGPALARAIPGAEAPTGPTACAGWSLVNLTHSADRDELWPTWTGATAGDLAYSVGIDDALPDLAEQRLDWSDDLSAEDARVVVSSPVMLTDTEHVAETQPSSMRRFSENTWLAFTTTQFRPDGSLGMAELTSEGLGEVVDPLETTGEVPMRASMQASQAAWSSPRSASAIAFTSTQEDPYGDVWVADLYFGEDGQPRLWLPARRVAGVGGQAESHPAWTDEYYGTAGSPGRSVVVTRRRFGDYVTDPKASVGLLDGAIGDARAADGGDRRVLIDDVATGGTRHDESSPSYSAVRDQIVHVRDSNQLVVTNADLTGAEVVVPAQPGITLANPAWSPDGSRIAFTRTRVEWVPTEDPEDPEDEVLERDVGVWLLDVATGETTSLTGPGEEDRHPAWTPDGRWVFVARSGLFEERSEDPTVTADGARRNPRAKDYYHPILWALDTENPGYGVGLDRCQEHCWVSGRSPAISPDGTTIAFIENGSLSTYLLDPEGPDLTYHDWDVTEWTPVTGFDAQVMPLPSRHVIESAEDPVWSPDGSEITFSGQPVGLPDSRQIFSITPDGSQWRQVTDSRGPDTEPAYWTPPPVVEADLRVRVRLDATTGYVGGRRTATVRVVNRSPRPASGVGLQIVWPAHVTPVVPAIAEPPTPECLVSGTACPIGTIEPGASVEHRVDVLTPTEGVGAIDALVTATSPDPRTADNRVVVDLPVLQPAVRVFPAVARPGQAVLVLAEDLPPRSTVDLEWSQGIGVERGTFVVGKDGTVRVPIFLIRRDKVGSRQITVTSVTDPVEPGEPAEPVDPDLPVEQEFSPITGDLLVVLRTSALPDLGRG